MVSFCIKSQLVDSFAIKGIQTLDSVEDGSEKGIARIVLNEHVGQLQASLFTSKVLAQLLLEFMEGYK